MKSHFIIVVALVLCNLNGISQITTNELPSNFENNKFPILASEEVITLPLPDLNKVVKEDAIEAARKDMPWRFGVLIPVSYNLANSGNWTDFTNGKSVWRLTFAANRAKSLNFNFDDFYLSPSSKLFIYGKKKNDILGAITKNNNKANRQFATRPIFADTVTLQLEVNTSEKKQTALSIEGVVYGYRSIKDKADKTFNSSGVCNNNVACPIGDKWGQIQRSVVLITRFNNTRVCTGTLINNVRQDSTPFILSATHCGLGGNSVFIFNYKSPTCTPNSDGPLSNSINGAISRAQLPDAGSSDFHLFELSSKPPASYNVVYAGWSAENVPPLRSAGIHHPRGDVMKISIDLDPAITAGYEGSVNDHWQVNDWDFGTTEIGSSGSGLFDQNQRIIGQLHGGTASCNNNAEDSYGKVAYSWATNPANDKQLKHWLDPDNTGTLTLDMFDPNSAPFNNDLELFTIAGIETYVCDSLIQPFVVVKNKGNNTVKSFQLSYGLSNGILQNITINRTLRTNELYTVSLPELSVVNGDQKFMANVQMIGVTDQDLSTNSDSFQFQVNANPIQINFTLTTDDYGDETYWLIRNPTNQVVLHQGGPYAATRKSVIYNETLCLYDSCFTFELFDSASDGFSGTFGNGSILLTSPTNDTVLHINNFTKAMRVDSFCVSDSLNGLNELYNENAKLMVYPNPVSNGNSISIKGLEGQQFSVELFDLTGRLVATTYSQEKIYIGEQFKSGIYFIRATDRITNDAFTQKLIVR